MRIFFLHGDHESGPYGLEDVRDRLDLRMIPASQPCRIAGRPGRFVAGEIVAGELFRAWDEEEEDPDDDEDKTREGGEEEETGDEDEGETDREDKPGEEEEDWEEENLESTPLWSGHPGLGIFPAHLGLTVLLVALAAAAWFLEWSGWMATGFAALSCFAFALLLARRQAMLYELHEKRAQCTSGLFFTRIKEMPRRAVDAIDVRMSLASGLRGRGDVVFHCTTAEGPEEFVFRQVFRPGRIRQLWR